MPIGNSHTYKNTLQWRQLNSFACLCLLFFSFPFFYCTFESIPEHGKYISLSGIMLGFPLQLYACPYVWVSNCVILFSGKEDSPNRSWHHTLVFLSHSPSVQSSLIYSIAMKARPYTSSPSWWFQVLLFVVWCQTKSYQKYQIMLCIVVETASVIFCWDTCRKKMDGQFRKYF